MCSLFDVQDCNDMIFDICTDLYRDGGMYYLTSQFETRLLSIKNKEGRINFQSKRYCNADVLFNVCERINLLDAVQL